MDKLYELAIKGNVPAAKLWIEITDAEARINGTEIDPEGLSECIERLELQKLASEFQAIDEIPEYG